MSVLGGQEDIWVAVLTQGEDISGGRFGRVGGDLGCRFGAWPEVALVVCFTGEARNLVVASDKLD